VSRISASAGALVAPRALVIVDSRNVVGQASRVLGEPAHPDVEGIRTALARYGFEVTKVLVALAIPRSGDRTRLATQLRVNEAYSRTVQQHPIGEVLLGELHARERRGGRLDAAEKMVDTGCTVEIVRHARDIADGKSPYDAIVVISEDIDLSPAYRYADELGVPVYPAACAVVDRRPDYHRNFVLLTPDVLAEMCPPGQHGRVLRGHDLRSAAAEAFRREALLEVELAEHYEGPHSGTVTCTPDGLLCVVADRDAPARGQSVRVRASHLHFGDASDPLFPYIRGTTSRAGGDRFFRSATVDRWKRPGVLDVTMGNGDRTSLSQVPLGRISPGSTVAVYAKDNGSKFVGLLGTPAPVVLGGDAADTTFPVQVSVTDIRKNGAIRGELPAGIPARVLVGRPQQPVPGQQLTGIVVGTAGPWLAVQALSTPLPRTAA
jgi:hypothetical protein